MEVKSGDYAEEVGGINLDPSLLDLQIKRDGQGIPLPMSQQDPALMNIQGFIPVINSIMPCPNLLLSLGVNPADIPPAKSASTAPVTLTWVDRREGFMDLC